MLVAHRLIDVLMGRSDEAKLSVVSEWDNPVKPVDYLRMLAFEINRAEKFEFVSIPFEPTETGARTPELTQDEADAWQQGLLPLPAPCVWYEFTMNGCRSAYLVQEDFGKGGEWVYERFDWLPGQPLVIWGLKIGLDKKAFAPLRASALVNNSPVHYMGDIGAFQKLPLKSKQDIFPLDDALFAIYLTMMINSRTTEITGEPAPQQLNRARIKKGRAPLFSHSVVRIVPKRFVTGRSGGTHASPRLHWRRSHVRTIHRETPQERKILIPRCLVGRADLGEVSHEYRVG